MNIRSPHNRGFTIVELLIVIIIIGILATITLIAYRSVTDQANNAKTLHYAEQWKKAIDTYRLTHTVLPNDWTCLGNDVNNFPEDSASSTGLGVCEKNFFIANSMTWTSEYKTVATVGQSKSTPAMLAADQSVTDGSLSTLKDGSAMVRGIVYASIFGPSEAPNGQPGAYILYALKNATCPNGKEYKVVGTIHGCAIKLTDENYATQIFDPVNPVY